MEIKDLSWTAFKNTGDIDAYLLYREIEDKKQWNQSKQGLSSQDGQTTGRQTAY
ncbi:MAG: YqzL family protein [Clostridiales bacterium]|nr:YqzL family protein [Clostridiales bacterium]